MSEFKYVMLGQGMFAFPIIFPDKLVHSQVVRGLNLGVEQFAKRRPEVLSAGFLSDLQVKIDATQRSETLNVGPNPYEDQRLINLFRYGHGIR